ncbi:MAG: glycosyltransferase family 4 protein [Paracoccaceae bacterium]
MLTQRYIPFTGGAEKQLSAVLRLLPDLGIDATVITRRHDDSPLQDVVEGFPVSRIAVRGPRVLASLDYTQQAVRLLRRFGPDVVHAHELLSPTTAALAHKVLTGCPVVAKVLRGGSLGDVAVLERSPIGRLRLKRLMPAVDAFAVISSEIDAELASYDVPAGRRHFIPNGVDLSRFQPADPQRKAVLRQRLGLPSGPIGFFAGRLEGEKRIDRLVTLWPQVRKALPSASLVVAGAGQLADALISARIDGVLIVGPQSDLRDWYAAADVFILPSEAEGLSNAMLEALATGLACVATRVGAAPELLSDGMGLLVDVDDDDGLVSATVAVLRGLPGHSAEHARQTIIQNYDISETASRLAALYHRLAAERGSR